MMQRTRHRWFRGAAGSTVVQAPERLAVRELEVIRDTLDAGGRADVSRVRIVELDDRHRPALSSMVRRCSDETLRRRFHSSLGPGAAELVVDLLTGAAAVAALVAETDVGAVVGVATLHRARTGVADFAVMVEDAWQSAGLGHLLTSRVIARARALGFSTAVADVLRQPGFLLTGLTRNNRHARVDFDGPVATVRIPLEAGSAARLHGAVPR